MHGQDTRINDINNPVHMGMLSLPRVQCKTEGQGSLELKDSVS